MRALFTQERVAVLAGLFLNGLLGHERLKTGWMQALAPGVLGRNQTGAAADFRLIAFTLQFSEQNDKEEQRKGCQV